MNKEKRMTEMFQMHSKCSLELIYLCWEGLKIQLTNLLNLSKRVPELS